MYDEMVLALDHADHYIGSWIRIQKIKAAEQKDCLFDLRQRLSPRKIPCLK